MLKQGDQIKIATGGEATILEELGTGGQGTVYKVVFNHKEYALKWYHQPGKAEFYDNLKIISRKDHLLPVSSGHCF